MHCYKYLMHFMSKSLQCESLQHENVSVVSELSEVRSAAQHMHAMLDEGDARGAQLGMQLMAAQVRYRISVKPMCMCTLHLSSTP